MIILDPIRAFIAALVGALAENLPLEDNITIPLFVGIALSYSS
nr:hypothetical protein [Methanothermus fervidus]